MDTSTMTRSEKIEHNQSTERFVKIIACVATIGGLLFGYDTGVISGALLFMSKDLHLTPFTEGLVTSSLLFGAAFGALISGSMANSAGRKRIILGLAVIFTIGTLGTSFAPNVTWMVAFRFILGLAVGGAASTVPIYIAEISPANKRGKMVTTQEFMIVLGQLIAYSSNAALNQIWGGDATWRWMLALATVPAIALWFGMMFMPDTPRWYAMKGRFKKARQVLDQTRPIHQVEEELEEIKTHIEEQKKEGKPSVKEVFQTTHLLHILLIGIGIAIIQQASGINAIMYYAPTILIKVGMASNAALMTTIANGVISIFMTGFGIWLIGKVGRRTLALSGQIGCMSALAFIVIASYFIPETVAGHPNMFRGYIVIAGMLIFLSFQQAALSPSTWILLSEIFPSRFRSIFMGIAIFVMWITNFTISLLFPVLLTAIGLSETLMIFIGFGILASIFVFKFVPETRLRSLEEIESDLESKFTRRSRRKTANSVS